MVTCAKCGTGKLRKRRDNWFYCTKHGFIRQAKSPEYTAPNGLGETSKETKIMDFQIVEKGVTVEIKDKAGKSLTNAYVGAGWDFVGKPVDLDLVAACLANGKLTDPTRLVYFGDKSEPGVQLSEDNTTGEGDGDDESIVFDLTKVEADVNSIAIGIAAYSGADLSTAKNFHFRIVDGMNASGTQLFEAKMQDAKAGDTVLVAGYLKRTATGWTFENTSTYHQMGNGKAAIQGFANLFSGAQSAAA